MFKERVLKENSIRVVKQFNGTLVDFIEFKKVNGPILLCTTLPRMVQKACILCEHFKELISQIKAFSDP